MECNEKALLNLSELASYLNIGTTQARKIMKKNDGGFVIKQGNRYYAYKPLLDEYLYRQAKKGGEGNDNG
jgi:hypothetical protein